MGSSGLGWAVTSGMRTSVTSVMVTRRVPTVRTGTSPVKSTAVTMPMDAVLILTSLPLASLPLMSML
ncbi:hypothetical protein D3C87_2066540 [compost metagenome]